MLVIERLFVSFQTKQFMFGMIHLKIFSQNQQISIECIVVFFLHAFNINFNSTSIFTDAPILNHRIDKDWLVFRET